MSLVFSDRRMRAMKPVGKPYAGNPHVRFDERGRETEPCQPGLRGRCESTANDPPGGYSHRARLRLYYNGRWFSAEVVCPYLQQSN